MRPAHGLGWAEEIDGGGHGIAHLVECRCGARWVRGRLADAAVALERHAHEPSRFPGEDQPEPSSLPTGNRRRTTAGDTLPSERQ